MGNRRIDCVFCDIAAHTEVIVLTRFLGQTTPLLFHLIGGLPCADKHFADAPHRLTVRCDNRKSAHVMKNIFCGDRLAPDAAFCKCHVLWY